MIGTERFLADRQRSLVQRFRIGIAPLLVVQERKIVQRRCDIGMIGTERFFAYRQRALVQRLGIGIATLVVVENRKIVQRQRNIGMIGTERFLANRQRALVQRLGIGIATLVLCRAQPDCSATPQHRDDRDRALFLVSPTIACTAAPHRHSDLGLW